MQNCKLQQESSALWGVDTFDGADWVQGDFNTSEEALAAANENGGKMTKMHVYNDKGEHLGMAGTF